MTAKVRQVPGAVDVHIQQLFNQPKLHLTVDRSKAEQLGLTERDVANSVLVSLSNSFQTSPSFFLNPVNGVSYNLATQAPQYRIQSLSDLEDLPITSANGQTNQLLVNLATFKREEGAAVATHYDIKPVVDILVSVQGRDLGAVAKDITAITNTVNPTLPAWKGMLPYKDFLTKYVVGKDFFKVPPPSCRAAVNSSSAGRCRRWRPRSPVSSSGCCSPWCWCTC